MLSGAAKVERSWEAEQEEDGVSGFLGDDTGGLARSSKAGGFREWVQLGGFGRRGGRVGGERVGIKTRRNSHKNKLTETGESRFVLFSFILGGNARCEVRGARWVLF